MYMYNVFTRTYASVLKSLCDVFQKALKNGVKTLAAFTYEAGPTAWPKSCPSGYSQHLFAIYEGCAINYCVKANALSDLQLPIIKRPPFQKVPYRI